MKYSQILISGVIVLSLSSCAKTQSSSKNDTVVEDSIPPIIEAPAEHHQDEDKVVAELKFFINEKDFDKNKDKYLADIRDVHMMRYNIGNYEATWAHGFFENDSLYYVKFSGQPFDIDDYDSELVPQYKELYGIYKSKYGIPTFERSSFPECYETNDGHEYLLAKWDLDKRTISIGLEERSPYYMINLQIYRNDITERINQRSEKEQQTNRQSAESVI